MEKRIRPFSDVPIGYKRVKLGSKGYRDEIDRSVAYILKAGLELFANDPTVGQTQLYHFLIDSGLQSPSGKKIWITYLEKMFQIHRLYFYAGYCTYPLLGVDELIEGRHEGIISLETAEKIRQKVIGGKKNRPLRDDNRFVLKQLITCKGGGRKLTGWTTVKSKTKAEYHYY
ncbi:MAG: hypothetical protein LBG52_07610 [Candidatus Peribacteria bacterium]|nr:hypothetical protein [Candidatus Peribacteria bacterium]